MTADKYQLQAEKFLARFGLKFSTSKGDTRCPDWVDSHSSCGAVHGLHYRVTLRRNMLSSLTFDFWNSIDAREKGEKPTAYDVLSCISLDLNCPVSFEEFCSEYGYNQDSRKDEKLWRRCNRFAHKLRDFFPDDKERAALAAIQ
jgi:hypothetical protein